MILTEQKNFFWRKIMNRMLDNPVLSLKTKMA